MPKKLRNLEYAEYTKAELDSVEVTIKGLLPNGEVGEYKTSASKALEDIDVEIALYLKIKACVEA
jgi:hypothetical protein